VNFGFWILDFGFWILDCNDSARLVANATRRFRPRSARAGKVGFKARPETAVLRKPERYFLNFEF
jgi:hypothetical protein